MARAGRGARAGSFGSRGHGRDRAGGRGRGRGRGRGSTAPQQQHRRNGFQTSRLAEIEDQTQEEIDENSDSNSENNLVENESQVSSDSEDETHAQQSYASLLRALNTRPSGDEPPQKKRKIETRANGYANGHSAQEAAPGTEDLPPADPFADAGLKDAIEEEPADDGVEHDSDDEDAMLHDPFETHYVRMEAQKLDQGITAAREAQRIKSDGTVAGGLRKTMLLYAKTDDAANSGKRLQSSHLKQRLAARGSQILNACPAEEKDFAKELFAYKDIQYGHRSVRNASKLREVTCLHALNHVYKTRDRVLKNNTKASQQTEDDNTDFRDQGFTRPKILFIVPTKQACTRFVDCIAQISEPDQQENKSRFLETFSAEDDPSWDSKPEDFRELFGGNHEEDFRVGLKFTRKTIKYFSGFYNSDIIFGSALGLMRTITTGGGSSKDKKSFDADFLSSIEMVIVDHASAIQMQNWSHLEYVFTQLNLLPKDSHGCDFGRVRNWYLDGKAKYLRQTILLSAYHTPEMNALFTAYANNISGLVKYTPDYTGAMLSLPPTIPLTPPQTFLRFESKTPQSDSDSRFAYFTTAILPPLLRHKTKGVLLFVPTYADFTRLRNYFSTSAATTSLNFGSVSEYTAIKEASRARSHFTNGRHHILLYTERAHHHFRYRIRGVKRIVFYGVPENPVFWGEVLETLALGANTTTSSNKNNTEDDVASILAQGGARSKGIVRALFSKWDVMKLERIVGTERFKRLISERGGDTFEFV